MSESAVWECVCVCVGEEVFVGGRESVWESVGVWALACVCVRVCACDESLDARYHRDTGPAQRELLHYG